LPLLPILAVAIFIVLELVIGLHLLFPLATTVRFLAWNIQLDSTNLEALSAPALYCPRDSLLKLKSSESLQRRYFRVFQSRIVEGLRTTCGQTPSCGSLEILCVELCGRLLPCWTGRGLGIQQMKM
jgi:hypothetical protein